MVELNGKKLCECSIHMCESLWHPYTELRAFEECPICKSVSFHLNINDGIKLLEKYNNDNK